MTPEADAVLAYARTLAPTDKLPVAAGVLLELADLAEQGSGVERLLTVADLAKRYGVAESTARAWLADGLCPADKLAGLGWRVPPDALPVLEASLREKAGDPIDLSAWRRTRRPAA